MSGARARMRRWKPSRAGQIVAGVMVLVVACTIMIPIMVSYTIAEAKWTEKQARSTTSLHMAEAGIEKGYMALSATRATWDVIQEGTPLKDFHFDKAFTDVAGGTYAVSITSGPLEQEVTIIGVGKDLLDRSVRSVKTVYMNSPMGGVAIYAGEGVRIGGGVNVEWGAVVSPQTVVSAGRSFPQFWSASDIVGFDTDPAPPNCDRPNCLQWHSYASNILPQPTLDLDFYRTSATATGTYFDSDQVWKGFAAATGRTYFVDGNLTLESPGIDVTGTIIVAGNMDTGGGAWGSGTRTMRLPGKAWKQYGNDWEHYRTFDEDSPEAFPGINSAYDAPDDAVFVSRKISVEGLVYVGGSFLTGAGGGQADVYGTLFVAGSSTMTNNSGVTVFFNDSASKNIRFTKVFLARESWRDDKVPWPAGL